MERKVVVASHGEAARGIADSVNMILGEIHTEIETFTLQPGQHATSFAMQLQEEMKQRPQTEYIILTDIYGASVCSSMYELIENPNVWLFSGVNVNMLLSVCLEYPDKLTDVDAMKIVEDACLGIRWLKKQERVEEDF